MNSFPNEFERFDSNHSYSVYIISGSRVINVWSFPEQSMSTAKTFSTKLKKVFRGLIYICMCLEKFLDLVFNIYFKIIFDRTFQ